MTYDIQITPTALRNLKKLPKSESTRILSDIESIQDDPLSYVIKLQGINLYRLRSGNYRVIMSINRRLLLVITVKVGHRRDVYKKF